MLALVPAVLRALSPMRRARVRPTEAAPVRAGAAGTLAPLSGPLTNTTRSALFLCAHSVHPDGPPFLSTPPALFARQLAFLREHGFRSGRLADLDGLREGRRPDRPLVFLTFDDGFADNHDAALPMLAEHGFTPIVFLLPAFVGGPELRWPEAEEERARHPDVMRPLTWEQIDRMAAAGAEFGAHGMGHAAMTELGDEELAQQLLDSRRAVAARVGSCDVLAYPFGRWDLRVALAAVSAGYRYAFALNTSAQGRPTPMSIPRICIDQLDEPKRLALKANPGVRRLLMSPHVRAVRDRLHAP